MHEAELIAEFQSRLAYLARHYAMARKILGNDVAFNKGLARLKRRLAATRKISRKQTRLHPEIEIVISHHARRLARDEGVEVDGKHVRAAARIASKLLKPRGGRPDDGILKHHVTGLVALIQEFSGKPVLARRNRNSVYDPHFADGMSRIVPMEFENAVAGITEAALVRIVEGIRREYAGKPLRFLDLFPGYGANPGNDGFQLRPALRLEVFEPSIAVFCH
ncbi:MAG: hypothetical protein AAFW97_12175 [Pseudomonadota bacterium]